MNINSPIKKTIKTESNCATYSGYVTTRSVENVVKKRANKMGKKKEKTKVTTDNRVRELIINVPPEPASASTGSLSNPSTNGPLFINTESSPPLTNQEAPILSQIITKVSDTYPESGTLMKDSGKNSLNIDNDFYIYTDNDCISKEKCAEIIKLFDCDPNKKHSSTLTGINNNIINISYLNISNETGWSDIDNFLSSLLHDSIEKYITHILQKNKDNFNINMQRNSINIFSHVVDFGYQIQSYAKNIGFYDWHTDHVDLNNAIQNNINQIRLLTFIWYLNDVDVGGETEFINGLIKPAAGKLLLFPATFTYPHRYNVPISNDKYIISGWIGYKTNGYCL